MAKISKSRDNSDDEREDDDSPANTPIVMTKGYRREFVDPVRNYFDTNYSDLAKRAIAELWKRRFDPSHEDLKVFAETGLETVIPDYRHADFRRYLKDSTFLGIFVDDIDRFLSMNGHAKSLIDRMTNPSMRTVVIIQTGQITGGDATRFIHPYYTSAEAALFFKFIDNLGAEPVCTAAVVGSSSKVDLPPFLLIADDVAIEARRNRYFQQVQHRACHVAVRWRRVIVENDQDAYSAINEDFSNAVQDTDHILCDFTAGLGPVV